MASIDFKGKTIVWNHHLSVPYYTLEEVKELSYRPENPKQHLVIEGDNLLALKSLLPKYSGSIKCIYIDPPYNTGNEGWVYNDKVNSPLIKEWLDNEVGKDDLTRHDKWLCMMTPRLKLLWELLADDGVLFISIDDNEIANLRILMDEIVGEESFTTTIHVEMSTVQGQKVKPAKEGNIVKNAEYILVYSKNKAKNIGKKVLFDPSGYDNHYSIYLEKSESSYTQTPLTQKICADDKLFKKLEILGLAKYKNKQREMPNSNISKAYARLGEVKDFIHQNSDKIVRLHDTIGIDRSRLSREIRQDEVIEYTSDSRSYLITMDRTGEFKQLISLREKVNKADDFYNTYGITTIRGDWWDGFYLDMGNVSREGGVEYNNGKKPVRLIKQLISFVSNENDIILDSFAGSGTTAHAVLELNKEDRKKRKFILVQMTEATRKELNKNVCKDKTQPRVINAINENSSADGFVYQRLTTPIDAEAMLSGTLPSFKEFAKYVYYLATGKNLANEGQIKENSFYVGKHANSQVYLIYKQDMASLTKLALTLDFAEQIKQADQNTKKVVYAPACFLDEEYLAAYNIQFVSIPYNLFDRVS
jgi:adenine-specific DNA-methyltransferase